jgi:phosphonate transport system ATP-binding protein
VTLQLDDVSVSLGGRAVLLGVTLTVSAGERVAIVGPSGAGKSTLLAVMHGRIVPTSGSVVRFGERIVALRGRKLRVARRRVAMMHQDMLLAPNLRVVHNIHAGCAGVWSTRRLLWSLLRPRPTAHVVEKMMELGLVDRLNDRTESLSGGELQRVGIARLLAPGAELLLADEPTASLDPARSEQVAAMLAAAADPRTTIVTSLHSVDLACRHFDRLIALRNGRVVFDDAPAELPPGWQARLYSLDDSA